MARVANFNIEIRWSYKGTQVDVEQISLDPIINEGSDDWIDNPESLQDLIYDKLCELKEAANAD